VWLTPPSSHKNAADAYNRFIKKNPK